MTAADGTVFVVDDDPEVRDSLRWLLESASLNVETFASAEEFLDHLDPQRIGCLVADVLMPGMSGLALQRELEMRGVSIPIIFLSAHGDVPMAVRACKAGALDFIEKPATDDTVLARVLQGLARCRAERERAAELADFTARVGLLSVREREIMELVVAGMTSKEIAGALGLSPRTVEVHRARVMAKLSIESIPALVRLCVATGTAGRGPESKRQGSP